MGYMYNAIKWVRVFNNLNGELSLNFGSTILQNLMKLKLNLIYLKLNENYLFKISKAFMMCNHKVKSKI